MSSDDGDSDDSDNVPLSALGKGSAGDDGDGEPTRKKRKAAVKAREAAATADASSDEGEVASSSSSSEESSESSEEEESSSSSDDDDDESSYDEEDNGDGEADEDEAEDASSDEDDLPLSALKSSTGTKKATDDSAAAKKKKPAATTKKAPAKKKKPSAKKSAPAKKKKTSTASTPASPSTKTAVTGTNSNNYVCASSELYAKSEKGTMIKLLLSRWWYAMTWPDPSTLPRHPPRNTDALDGFPGVYVHTRGDSVGRIVDLRDKSTCPNFVNMAHKTTDELKEMLLRALENQREALVQSEGKGTKTEKDLNEIVKWAKKVNGKKADKKAETVLKAAKLKLAPAFISAKSERN